VQADTAPSIPARWVGDPASRLSTRVIAKAKKIAASMLEVDEATFPIGQANSASPGTDIAPLTSARWPAWPMSAQASGRAGAGLDETVFTIRRAWRAFGIHMAYVDVDPETGIVDISIMLPWTMPVPSSTRCCAGQIHGGVVQGIAQALYEESSYDPDTRQLMTGSVLDYGVPRRRTCPQHTIAVSADPSPTTRSA